MENDLLANTNIHTLVVAIEWRAAAEGVPAKHLLRIDDRSSGGRQGDGVRTGACGGLETKGPTPRKRGASE